MNEDGVSGGNNNGDNDGDGEVTAKKPSVAKHFLLFMFRFWDARGVSLKRSVARFSVCSSNGEDLKRKILKVIAALPAYGFIVNQLASNSATENMLEMKQLANTSVKEAFPDGVQVVNGEKEYYPDSEFMVAFRHPVFDHVLVYIGGEMLHWIKKFVNAMECSSDPKSKRDMELNGCKINLGMIEKVWQGNLLGINTLKVIQKLTEDHFQKNSHNRMKVHLAAQILSRNVHRMLERYCTHPDQEKAARCWQKYSSVMRVTKDTVIDIWNHHSNKKFLRDESNERYHPINKSDHEYIDYLVGVLDAFTDWKEESQTSGGANVFMPITLYKLFAYLVYGIKGVASQIPDGCAMLQQNGGTDDLENDFATFRQMSANLPCVKQ